MSRLAERAAASLGAAVLPPEHGGPTTAELAQRLDRYLTRLPAVLRLGVHAGLASLATTSYLTTGRPLARLGPDKRAQVLHRLGSINPDVEKLLEALKVI